MNDSPAPFTEEIYRGFRLAVQPLETPRGTFRARLTISPLTGENDLAVRDSLAEYPTTSEATSANLRFGTTALTSYWPSASGATPSLMQ